MSKAFFLSPGVLMLGLIVLHTWMVTHAPNSYWRSRPK